jgi:hypothetical protein
MSNEPLISDISDDDLTTKDSGSKIDWSAIIAGGVAAAAISTLLMSFGGAVGLSLTSPRPFVGLSASVMAVLISLWLAVVHVGSFASGGYLAGRMRARSSATQDERAFRDGAHGFLVWAIGTLLATYLIVSGVGAMARGTAQTAAPLLSAATQAVSNMASSSAAPSDPIGYTADLLLRRPTGAPTASANNAREESVTREITRIIGMAIVNDSISTADRQHLASIVAERTGLSPADADKRVAETWSRYRSIKEEAAQKLSDAAEMSRKAAVLMAFLLAAVSLSGLVAATWGASVGSLHRDQNQSIRILGTSRIW